MAYHQATLYIVHKTQNMYLIQICWRPLHRQTYTYGERERERERQRKSCIYTTSTPYSPTPAQPMKDCGWKTTLHSARECSFADLFFCRHDMPVKNPWLNCCQTGLIKPFWPCQQREHLSKMYQKTNSTGLMNISNTNKYDNIKSPRKSEK